MPLPRRCPVLLLHHSQSHVDESARLIIPAGACLLWEHTVASVPVLASAVEQLETIVVRLGVLALGRRRWEQAVASVTMLAVAVPQLETIVARLLLLAGGCRLWEQAVASVSMLAVVVAQLEAIAVQLMGPVLRQELWVP